MFVHHLPHKISTLYWMNFLSRSKPEILFVCAKYGAFPIKPSFSNAANKALKCSSGVCLSADALSLYLVVSISTVAEMDRRKTYVSIMTISGVVGCSGPICSVAM